MLASSLGVQSITDLRMGPFSSLALLLKEISSGTLWPMESKMFGFVRQDPTNQLYDFAPKVGSAATNGSFEEFRERLVTSRVEVCNHICWDIC